MEVQTVYHAPWHYDIWSDIEAVYPKGLKISCEVSNVCKDYAFLKTPEGISCFLGRNKVVSRFQVSDLTEIISIGDNVTCRVRDYNHEKKNVAVDLLFD